MGLLDMFGPPQGGGGLLDPSTYDPRMDIALGIANQLLENAGPSATRRGAFQGVPGALMQGRQGAFQRQVQQQQYADMLTASAERKRQAEARTKFGAMMAPAYTRADESQPWQQQESNVDQDGLLAAFGDAFPDAAAKGLGGLLYPEEKVIPDGAMLVRGGEVLASRPKAKDAPSGYEWGPDGKLRPMAGGPAETQGPFKGTGMDAQALGVVYGYESKKASGQPTTPDEDYGYQLAKWQLTQPRVVGTPESGFYPINPPALPTRQAPAAPAIGGAAPPSTAQQPVGPAPQAQAQGGPTVGPALTQPQGRPLSAEAQKQLTLANTAKNTLDVAVAAIAPGDSVDRTLLYTMNGNVPFTAGRQVLGQLKEVIQNAVYLKSGAAAGQEEMNGYYQTYLPSTGDNDATVKDKLARLRSFLDQAASAARSRNGITDGAEPAAALPQPKIDADLMRQIEARWK